MHPRARVFIMMACLASAAGHAAAAAPTTMARAERLVLLAQEGRPTDLNKYSLRFWPRNSLSIGQVVTTNTPYGKLTCRSTGRGQPRDCSLSRR
jgi:hypothetical protein